MLVYPLFVLTEASGIAIILLQHASIGWAICAAPLVGLAVTGAIVRPSLSVTAQGIVQRQYPFVSTLQWKNVSSLAIVQARGRTLLAYKLKDGVPPPRRQPVAVLLAREGLPYDGGYFVDTLSSTPEDIHRAAQESFARSDAPAGG